MNRCESRRPTVIRRGFLHYDGGVPGRTFAIGDIHGDLAALETLFTRLPKLDASDIVAKVVYYALVLFVLQFAFGVFGPNPVSDLLAGIISFLPKIVVAIIIVVGESGRGKGEGQHRGGQDLFHGIISVYVAGAGLTNRPDDGSMRHRG